MKKYILSITSLLVALCLNSCFQQETTVHLKKDGSGTITSDVRLTKQMLAMPAEDLKMMLAEAEKSAKQQATQFGEGVTFVKFEKINQGDSKGWRSSYRFEDINKIKVRHDCEMTSNEGGPIVIENEKLITFKYSDGNLTIRPNMDKEADKGNKPDAAAGGEKLPDEVAAPMKAMLGELKYSIKLAVDPGISDSNATHRAGNTITLLEVDMSKVLEKDENIRKLRAVDEKDKSAALQALRGVDGVKMETKPEITVKLK